MAGNLNALTVERKKTRLILPAPGKLNLFLHITGRRNDGYHLLQTVFQLLDYGDEITLDMRNDGQIRKIKGLDSVPESSDLCVRAARLLKERFVERSRQTNALQTNALQTALFAGVDLSITKVLPMGGGTGGGSSDAATVLMGLNELWDCGFSVDELAELGLLLGADVPVFVRGFSAWAEGVGEQLCAVELPEKWFVVIHPGISVSTAEIFLDKGLTRDCEPIKIARFLQADGFSNTINVFQTVVRKKHPQVAKALDTLSNFTVVDKPARLTGSGSCLFAAFDSEQDAQSVLDEIQSMAIAKQQNWQGFVAKGVNQSPLKKSLGY